MKIRDQGLFLKLFFFILLMRIALAVFLPLGADEAYYYTYALNPSLSYFDHPPLVALAGGVIPNISGIVNPFTIRLIPLMLFSISVWFFYLLSCQFMDKKQALFSAGIYGAVPMFFISGSSLLPDATLIFFWVLSLYLFKKAENTKSIKGWIYFGLSSGMAMLSKYTGVFLFSGAFLYLLLNPRRRKLLLTPGPYASLLAGFAVFSPVIIWNISNGFASFAFHSGRVGLSDIKLRYFYQSFFGQMGYLLPFFFLSAVYFAFKSLRRIFNDEIFLFSSVFGSLPLMVFWIASLFRRGLPHWPLIGYISIAPLAGIYFYNLSKKSPKFFRNISFFHLFLCLAAGMAAVLQVNYGLFMNRELPDTGIPGRYPVRDLSIEIIGWDMLTDYFKNFEGDDIFLLTHRWELGGQVSAAFKGKYRVLCLNTVNRSRGFAFWQEQDSVKGSDAVFISTSRFFLDPYGMYKDYFGSIEYLEAIPVNRRGLTVKKIYLYRLKDFSGDFPVF